MHFDGLNDEPLPWKEFLTSYPPGTTARIRDLDAGKTLRAEAPRLYVPDLQLWCASCKSHRECEGSATVFNAGGGAGQVMGFPPCVAEGCDKGKEDNWFEVAYRYVCRDCLSRAKLFLVRVRVEQKERPVGVAQKAAEYPSFSPRMPSGFEKLIGPDREMFTKGRAAESQGMGIAAFAYYRRVVENQKDRIIDKIIQVTEKVSADRQMITELEAAKREQQFTKAIEMIKDRIPNEVLIKGHNPLTLLHAPLSKGLHNESDEECLKLATSVRSLLFAMSQRFQEILKEDQAVKDAITHLLQSQGTKTNE